MRTSCPHELSIDLQNGESPIMNDAAYNILTKSRENTFVKMPWNKR